MTTLGILAFIVAVVISVVAHEAGHFLTARRFGMKASQFFVGFGPTLWSFRRGETEYGLKAIVAGGYVKILGMTPLEEIPPPQPDAPGGRPRTGLAARPDEERLFWKQPAPQRAVVLAAGSFMHFVLAFVLLFAVLALIGLPTASRTVATVDCVAGVDCSANDPAPARDAGLKPGDEIVAVDGQATPSWDDVATAIRAHTSGTVTLTVDRDGQPVTLTSAVVPYDDGTTTVGRIGVSPVIVKDRENPFAAIGHSGSQLWQGTTATVSALVSVPSKIPQLFNLDKQRDGTGLAGPVGAARVSGELAHSDDPVAAVLLIVAGFNISVGLLNLLPLLPLDGGHLAILGFEEARKRVYRLLRRPAPGRVDLLKLMPAAYTVLLLLVGLSVLLLVNDIANPIQLGLQ